MNAALTRLLMQVAGAAALLAFVLVLQTRRISRIWLRWIPRTLRETLNPYFDPPPSIHPEIPDPNEIEWRKTLCDARRWSPAASAFF